MDDTYRAWIAAALLKRGKSKGGLASALGLHQSQVTRILDGSRQIKASEVPVMAEYLEEPPPGSEPMFEAEEPDDSGPPLVKVVGYVGAGATAHFYAVGQGELDEVEAPAGSTAATRAVEIRGDSLGLMFDRWLVFYDDVRRPLTPDLFGKLCVVGLADDRVLIKTVRKGSKSGLFTLVSEREPPIDDVVIEWAARVKLMAPR